MNYKSCDLVIGQNDKPTKHFDRLWNALSTTEQNRIKELVTFFLSNGTICSVYDFVKTVP